MILRPGQQNDPQKWPNVNRKGRCQCYEWLKEINKEITTVNKEMCKMSSSIEMTVQISTKEFNYCVGYITYYRLICMYFVN